MEKYLQARRANTLAYYNMATNTPVKSFLVKAPGAKDIFTASAILFKLLGQNTSETFTHVTE